MILAVAGAEGFLGAFVSRILAAAGHEVVGFGRGDPLPTRPLDVLVDCNGDSRRFWANANPGESFTANVASVAARATSGLARRYVLMSSIDVYGKGAASSASSREESPIDPAGLDVYGFHKWLAERVVERHCPDHLLLRLGTLVGPGLKKNPVFDAIHGHPIRQTPGSTLSLIDLDHVGRVLGELLAMDARGIYNVTCARSITVGRMLEVVAEATGRTRPSYHADLLATAYDVSIEKLAAVMPMPDAETMLRSALPLMTEPKG